MDFEKCKKAFDEYVDTFDLKNSLVLLKRNHTYQVVGLMAELAFRLDFSKEKIELAKLIGLLHDIGRFEQIRKFNSISDYETKMDHAKESCVYLFEQGHIRDFIEDNQYDSIIQKAILNHNRFKMEENLEKEELLFSKMIRDMDKVDIYRTLSVESESVLKASEITEKVLKEFQRKQTIDAHLIKTDSDKTIVRLAFIFDMNFDESYDILVSTDNFDLFLSTVEVEEDSEKLWKKLREICFDRINQGVGGKNE